MKVAPQESQTSIGRGKVTNAYGPSMIFSYTGQLAAVTDGSGLTHETSFDCNAQHQPLSIKNHP